MRWLLDNLTLVIFLAAAILPSITQAARKKAAQKPRRRDDESATFDRDRDDDAPAAPSLEERVARYFEEMKQQADEPPSAPTPPPLPERTPERATPPRQPVVVVPEQHPASDRRARTAPQLKVIRRGRKPQRSSRRGIDVHHLHGRRVLRDAIVIREVLGPPKALDRSNPWW